MQGRPLLVISLSIPKVICHVFFNSQLFCHNKFQPRTIIHFWKSRRPCFLKMHLILKKDLTKGPYGWLQFWKLIKLIFCAQKSHPYHFFSRDAFFVNFRYFVHWRTFLFLFKRHLFFSISTDFAAAFAYQYSEILILILSSNKRK